MAIQLPPLRAASRSTKGPVFVAKTPFYDVRDIPADLGLDGSPYSVVREVGPLSAFAPRKPQEKPSVKQGQFLVTSTLKKNVFLHKLKLLEIF